MVISYTELNILCLVPLQQWCILLSIGHGGMFSFRIIEDIEGGNSWSYPTLSAAVNIRSHMDSSCGDVPFA